MNYYYVIPNAFVFIDIPKVASTSISEAISDGHFPLGKSNISPNGVRRIVGRDPLPQSHGLPVKALVRHPFTRLVSLYYNRGKLGYDSQSAKDFRLRYHLSGRESFETFALKMMGLAHVDWDPHMAPQHTFIDGTDAEVFSFEKLVNVWTKWRIDHNFGALPHRARTNHGNWRLYYYGKPRLISVVAKFYAQDMRMFLYREPLPS